MRPFNLSDRSELTQERLRTVLSYSPETGLFTWVNPLRSFEKGKVAGTVALKGRYIMIKVSSIGFLGHILAWLYMTGEFPDDELDHEDGNGLNNKWTNIRRATRSKNCQNRVSKSNRHGVQGVLSRNGKFYGRVRLNKKSYVTSDYLTVEAAGSAVKILREALHAEFSADRRALK